MKDFFMLGFKSKKIETERTLGERLKERRQAQYLKLERLACEMKISKEYLEFLEKGEYASLPGEVYAKNFIKTYARILGLNSQELILLYHREQAVFHNIHEGQKVKMHLPTKIISRFHFLSTPKILRNLLISGVVFVCLLYLGLKVEAIIRPPQLEVFYPAHDILVEEKFIQIQGKTLPRAHVIINGQNVIAENDGNFYQTISLHDGINEITIMAKKDHSKEAEVIRRVVVRKK